MLEVEGTMIRKVLLTGVPFQPSTKACEQNLRWFGAAPKAAYQSKAEVWAYVTGDWPVNLDWPKHATGVSLEQDSSFFIQSNVPYMLSSAVPYSTQVVTMEIKPGAGDPVDELGLIYTFAGLEGLQRVHSETKQWF